MQHLFLTLIKLSRNIFELDGISFLDHVGHVHFGYIGSTQLLHLLTVTLFFYLMASRYYVILVPV
jgi:hypothetical protein